MLIGPGEPEVADILGALVNTCISGGDKPHESLEAFCTMKILETLESERCQDQVANCYIFHFYHKEKVGFFSRPVGFRDKIYHT